MGPSFFTLNFNRSSVLLTLVGHMRGRYGLSHLRNLCRAWAGMQSIQQGQLLFLEKMIVTRETRIGDWGWMGLHRSNKANKSLDHILLLGQNIIKLTVIKVHYSPLKANPIGASLLVTNWPDSDQGASLYQFYNCPYILEISIPRCPIYLAPTFHLLRIAICIYHYRKTGLCRLLKYFATCQRQGSRQTVSLPTASKSSRQRILCRLPNYPGRWQRKAVGKDVLCRLPSRWQRKAGGKDGCLAGGKGKLVAKVAGH